MGIRVVLDKKVAIANVAQFDSENISKVIQNKKALAEALINLDDRTLFYASDGAWSSIDLLGFLLLKLPKVESVYISTFSISEKAANNIEFIKANSSIKFHLLIDWKMKLKNPDTVLFLENVCDSFGFSDCHSKLTCLVSPDKTYTVLSSANYTRNKRFESGVIVSDVKVSEMYVEQIKKLIVDGVQSGAN